MEIDEQTEIIRPVVWYGDAAYLRRCPTCGRYVTPHQTAQVNDSIGAGPAYAECGRCGTVRLYFVGWGGDE